MLPSSGAPCIVGTSGIMIKVHVSPSDGDWIMGEDVIVNCDNDTSIHRLTVFIEDLKGISRHRMQLRPRLKTAVCKIIPPEKLGSTLRNFGFADGVVINFEPTITGGGVNSA